MAKNILPTNFVDDVIGENMGGKRRYNLIQNSDGTVSLEDVTDYIQVGSNFGAAQVNAINNAVNESVDKSVVIDNLADIEANTTSGKVAGALSVKQLNSKIIDTQYVKSYTLSIPRGEICLVCANVVGYCCTSLSDRIAILSIYKLTEDIQYTINNSERTVAFSAKDGSNIRFIVIRP